LTYDLHGKITPVPFEKNRRLLEVTRSENPKSGNPFREKYYAIEYKITPR
jgi:hypothetical protein